MGIDWRFSPSSGPYFGGVWEPQIQSAERTLYAVPKNITTHGQQEVWRRWIREYVPRLIAREKLHKPTRRLRVGDIALIVDNAPRDHWTSSRVIEPIAGKDGIIRQANVRTTNGKILRRPVVKLIVLEPGQDGEDDADRCRAVRAGDVPNSNNLRKGHP